MVRDYIKFSNSSNCFLEFPGLCSSVNMTLRIVSTPTWWPISGFLLSFNIRLWIMLGNHSDSWEVIRRNCTGAWVTWFELWSHMMNREESNHFKRFGLSIILTTIFNPSLFLIKAKCGSTISPGSGMEEWNLGFGIPVLERRTAFRNTEQFSGEKFGFFFVLGWAKKRPISWKGRICMRRSTADLNLVLTFSIFNLFSVGLGQRLEQEIY